MLSISNSGLLIDKKTFEKLIDKYKMKKFTVRERLSQGTPSVIQRHPRVLKLFKSSKNHIVLARGLLELVQKNTDIKLDVKFNKCRKFDKFSLGDNLASHQEVVLNEVVCRFSNEDKFGSYLMQLAPGLGKTRTAIAIIGQVGATTLVVVPCKHIALQWIEEMEQFTPHLKTCIYNNKTNQSAQNFDVILCIINTARDKDCDFFSQFAFAIMDEVHEHISNCNKEILWKTSWCRFVLGMSGTLAPSDVKNELLPYIEAHLGKVVHSRDLDGFDTVAKEFDVNVEIVEYIGNEEYLTPVLNDGGTISFVNTLSRIISDPQRIDLVLNKIRELYDKKCNIFVFGEHRGYLDNLYERLVKVYEKDEIDLESNADVLKGGATKDKIEKCKTHRIILTTFSYSRRGIDYSHLDALVLATPRKSGIKQIIGRILRFSGDSSIPRYILDVWDSATVLKSQLYERQKVYRSRLYKISKTKIEGNL